MSYSTNFRKKIWKYLHLLLFLTITMKMYAGLILGFLPSQWETVLLCHNISPWLGASLESGLYMYSMISQIAKLMGPTWGPPGSCRPQLGPMWAPWTLLSGIYCHWNVILILSYTSAKCQQQAYQVYQNSCHNANRRIPLPRIICEIKHHLGPLFLLKIHFCPSMDK